MAEPRNDSAGTVMSRSGPITMLVVSEHADEIKLVTISMRGFFPGCRVEAVYSADEALEWAPKSDWQLILIDDDLGARSGLAIIPDLRRYVPSAAIIVQSTHTDSSSALQAMRAGADIFLYKQSPAFLTELLFYSREALEKRELLQQLDSTRERHQRLLETMPDVVYELDPQGRFVHVSKAVTSLLGYAPEELTGTHYSRLLSPNQQQIAEHRFNDRRTGARSAHHVELHLFPKGSREQPIDAEIHAKGLYDSQRRFLGTVGLVRDLSQTKQQREKLHQLEIQLQETDRLLALAQRLKSVSNSLQDPLSSLLAESQRLLFAVRELGLEPKLEALTTHAAEAAQLGQELSQTIQVQSANLVPFAINEQLNGVIEAESARLTAHSITLDRQFDINLPTILGDLRTVREAFQLLVSFAQRRVSALSGHRYLRVITRLSPPAMLPPATLPTLFPLSPVTRVEVELVGGSDSITPTVLPIAPPTPVSSELLRAYRIIQDHGWTVDIDDSATGPIRIVLRLTTGETAPPRVPSPLTSDALPAITAKAAPITAPPPLPIAPQTERRQSERVETNLPVHLTVGTTPWEGSVINLSIGGALLSFQAPLIGLDDQPVHFVLRTAVSVLELHGVLKERPLPAIGPVSTNLHRTNLAVKLHPLRSEELAILNSMLQAIREGTLEVVAEGSVPSRESDAREDTTRSDGQLPRLRDLEQRQDLRLRLALPVHVESTGSLSGSNRIPGLTINLSRNGACLQVRAFPIVFSDQTQLLFTPTTPIAHGTGNAVPSSTPVFVGQVVWMAPDPTAPNELGPSPSIPALRIGIFFQRLGQQEERALNHLFSQRLSSNLDLLESNGRTAVVSRFLECRNSSGQRLALAEDHALHPIDADTPVVILASGFGRTKADEIELAYGLASNGLRVIRYDAANHLGLSDGEIQLATLGGLQNDMASVLSFARQTWPLAPVLVIASDLAARAALKVAGQQREVRAWLLLNTVLDVQATLATVHQYDHVGAYHLGARRGVTNLFGLNVDLDHFLHDLVAAEYTDLASTLQDIGSIQSPVILFPDRRTDTTDDRRSWTSPEMTQRVMAALGPQGQLVSGDRDEKQQASSPADASRWLLLSILNRCRQVMPSLTAITINREAPVRDITSQYLLEREQTRAYHDVSRLARRALWHTHLQHVPSFAETNAHWQLLDYLYRRLGPLDQNDVILDVGCGPGEVLRLILMNLVYRARHRPRQLTKAPKYVALGTPFPVLNNARSAFDSFGQELDRSAGGTLTAHPPLITNWICTEWQNNLPLMDRCCTRSLSILSLNFSDHPLTSLREIVRTLAPGGRLVVACMTHDTDLASIYRRHLHRSQQTELAEPHRTLLLYLGWLRQALCEGLVQTFDHGLLTSLFLQSGASRPRISSHMSGQILMAVAEKLPSSS